MFPVPVREGAAVLKLAHRISRRSRYPGGRIGAETRRGGLQTIGVESWNHRRGFHVRFVVNVHQSKVEIFAVCPAVCRFIGVLEPVRADHVRQLQQPRQGLPKRPSRSFCVATTGNPPWEFLLPLRFIMAAA